MLSKRVAIFALAMLSGVSSSMAFAHEGHEHHDEAAVANLTATPDVPRLVLESSRVELVAVREPDALVIYVDDHASNAPLSGLQVHVLLGTHALDADEVASGTYSIPDDLVDAAAEHETTIRFQLHGPSIDESLEGMLPQPPAATTSTAPSGDPAATRAAILVAGTVTVLVVFVTLIALRRRRRRDGIAV